MSSPPNEADKTPITVPRPLRDEDLAADRAAAHRQRRRGIISIVASLAATAIVIVVAATVPARDGAGNHEAGPGPTQSTSDVTQPSATVAAAPPTTSPMATAAPLAVPNPAGSTRPATRPAGPRTAVYQAASDFVPFGGSFAPVPVSANGTLLTVSSPTSYAHLWGAWLPGHRCRATVTFDVKVDAPAGTSPGYGYAVGPLGAVANDQPAGWTLQHEWDGAAPGFYTRPVLMPSGAWAGGGSVPAPDARQWHHVVVTGHGSTYTAVIDNTTIGAFSGPDSCGGLVFRVWGGATAYFDHIRVE